MPVFNIVDGGADITFIGGHLFQKVATVACLKKRHFKIADKMPWAYDQQRLCLDGLMDLDITFRDLTMCTPLYIKIDAPE